MIRYRPNVAALLLNERGKLLICERKTIPGAWQFPQGGVDAGESHKEALFREIREEIGLDKKHYKIIKSKDGYRYLYPPDTQRKKLRKHGNHGQEQTYYLCELNPNAPEIDVDQSPQEFRDYRWIKPEKFELNWLPPFKQEIYQSVMKDFFKISLK
ncbi:MAG: RNA pyrophosphohydrolase [Akkermansiaceae bacterium]